jgi:plasmid segregation protein ParM
LSFAQREATRSPVGVLCSTQLSFCIDDSFYEEVEMKICRAIDVGYGNTKYTINDGTHGGDIECRMFPSLAPQAPTSTMDSFLEKKNTVVVEAGEGNLYEVGPDSLLGMDSYSSRILDLDFARTDTYLALARGALTFMDVECVDFLVVGLPVSSMDAMAGLVKTRLQGVHPIRHNSVLVKEVLVVPQPVGGMYDFGVRNRLMREIESGTSLLIDPGYFTLDWVVTKGTKMVGARSGAANNAGMAAILRSVLDQLAVKVKNRDSRVIEVSESVLDRLDDAIRTGEEFRIFGRVENLDEYLSSPSPVVVSALNRMRTRVGSLDDIDRVIIVGGGAHMYEQAVLKLLPGFDIRISKNQVYSNVRGFQMLANIAAQKAALAAACTTTGT